MCAWLYREGFARFSNTRFSLDSIDDTCILFSSSQGSVHVREDLEFFGGKGATFRHASLLLRWMTDHLIWLLANYGMIFPFFIRNISSVNSLKKCLKGEVHSRMAIYFLYANKKFIHKHVIHQNFSFQ